MAPRTRLGGAARGRGVSQDERETPRTEPEVRTAGVETPSTETATGSAGPTGAPAVTTTAPAAEQVMGDLLRSIQSLTAVMGQREAVPTAPVRPVGQSEVSDGASLERFLAFEPSSVPWGTGPDQGRGMVATDYARLGYVRDHRREAQSLIRSSPSQGRRLPLVGTGADESRGGLRGVLRVVSGELLSRVGERRTTYAVPGTAAGHDVSAGVRGSIHSAGKICARLGPIRGEPMQAVREGIATRDLLLDPCP